VTFNGKLGEEGFERSDPEDEQTYLEESWPHLQVVYELLLRLVILPSLDARALKPHLKSPDPRERDYVKTVVHRVYGRFMAHRSFLRRAIAARL